MHCGRSHNQLANLAKRLECVQLAAAFSSIWAKDIGIPESQPEDPGKRSKLQMLAMDCAPPPAPLLLILLLFLFFLP